MSWLDRLIDLAIRVFDRASETKEPTKPYEPPANPRDIAIAVSSYERAKQSSEAAERGGEKAKQTAMLNADESAYQAAKLSLAKGMTLERIAYIATITDDQPLLRAVVRLTGEQPPPAN